MSHIFSNSELNLMSSRGVMLKCHYFGFFSNPKNSHFFVITSNYMKLNKDKCHLLVSGHKFELWESDSVTMLGVRFDRNLTFYNHVNELCKKAGRKLSAFTRLAISTLTISLQKMIFLYISSVWQDQFNN